MSRYEFSLLQEVLLEKGAGVLGDLSRYKRQNRIEERTHPVAILYSLVWNAKQDILSAKSKEELIGSKVSSIWQTSFFSKRGACKCIFRQMI